MAETEVANQRMGLPKWVTNYFAKQREEAQNFTILKPMPGNGESYVRSIDPSRPTGSSAR